MVIAKLQKVDIATNRSDRRDSRRRECLMTVTSSMSSPHEGDSRFARAQAKEESSPAHSRPRFPAASAAPLCRLVVHAGRRLVVLRPEEVEWIEGAGNYVRIHARGEVHGEPHRSQHAQGREAFRSCAGAGGAVVNNLKGAQA